MRGGGGLFDHKMLHCISRLHIPPRWDSTVHGEGGGGSTVHWEGGRHFALGGGGGGSTVHWGGGGAGTLLSTWGGGALLCTGGGGGHSTVSTEGGSTVTALPRTWTCFYFFGFLCCFVLYTTLHCSGKTLDQIANRHAFVSSIEPFIGGEEKGDERGWLL